MSLDTNQKLQVMALAAQTSTAKDAVGGFETHYSKMLYLLERDQSENKTDRD